MPKQTCGGGRTYRTVFGSWRSFEWTHCLWRWVERWSPHHSCTARWWWFCPGAQNIHTIPHLDITEGVHIDGKYILVVWSKLLIGFSTGVFHTCMQANHILSPQNWPVSSKRDSVSYSELAMLSPPTEITSALGREESNPVAPSLTGLSRGNRHNCNLCVNRRTR